MISGPPGPDRMVVGFSAYYHSSCEFGPCSCRGVLDTTLCDKVCQWLETGLYFSPGSPLSSINKTDRHDITEILLKVALNTINLNPNLNTVSDKKFFENFNQSEHILDPGSHVEFPNWHENHKLSRGSTKWRFLSSLDSLNSVVSEKQIDPEWWQYLTCNYIKTKVLLKHTYVTLADFSYPV